MLTGTGKAFSAGVDTKAAATLDREGQHAGVEAINSLVTTLFGLPLPVVAAVNGHALGGGLIVPLACDVLVATRAECKLGLTEVVAGVPFPAAPLAVCRHRLSAPAYNNLCLTGRMIGPEEALALGVVDELAAPQQLVERAVGGGGRAGGLPGLRAGEGPGAGNRPRRDGAGRRAGPAAHRLAGLTSSPSNRITLRMPSCASISSKPRFTSSRVSWWEMNASTSISPAR